MDNLQTDIPALESLIQRAQLGCSPPGGSPYVVVTTNQRVENIEHLMAKPVRKRGQPQFTRSESFVAYINQQKTAESRLYVPGPCTFVSVLDHHGETPDWGQHRGVQWQHQ